MWPTNEFLSFNKKIMFEVVVSQQHSHYRELKFNIYGSVYFSCDSSLNNMIWLTSLEVVEIFYFTVCKNRIGADFKIMKCLKFERTL